MQILAVRDRALDAFGTPIFVPHVQLAIRSFTDQINKEGTEFNAHPEDYDLYQLGEYEERTGLVVGQTPRQVAVGKDCVRPF